MTTHHNVRIGMNDLCAIPHCNTMRKDHGIGHPFVLRCPTFSSVTELQCVLGDGHTPWKPDRFHCFAGAKAEHELIDTSVGAIHEHRRWHDEDPEQGKAATCWKCAGHVRALLGFRAEDAKNRDVMEAQRAPSLNRLRDDTTAWAKRKGWHDDPRSPGDLLMLAVTELAEAMGEHRHHHALDEVYYSAADECGKCGRNGVKRTLDGAGPTEHEISEADGSADHRFVPAQKPEGVPIELVDCIIRIADMAGRWGIDLDAAVAMKRAYNEGRPYKHGGLAL